MLVYQHRRTNAMPFEENNKLGFTSDQPLDSIAISLKGRVGQREALKNIPNWQARIRDLVDQLIRSNP